MLKTSMAARAMALDGGYRSSGNKRYEGFYIQTDKQNRPKCEMQLTSD